MQGVSRAKARLRLVLIAFAGTLLTLIVSGAASAQLASSQALRQRPSPDLIERAQEAGRIDRERANLYLVYALTGDPRLPSVYESDSPYDGTFELLRARRVLQKMQPGPERRAVAAALRVPPDPNATTCEPLSVAPLPNSAETAHFYIQYNDATLEPSLDIEDYKQSLETAWLTEVDSFRWAAPPDTPLGAQELAGKYHVRIDALGPGLFGFVSPQGTYAGPVGDNPATPWNEGDADATCMGVNQDYTGFLSPPRESLDSTTAHEFKHSLQFGYGALNDATEPELNFSEGMATWMEDEVQDGANDNYNYLYPEFDDSMGQHQGDEYAYWLTFRGLFERFGANVPGGSEQVSQDFWEIISRNDAVMLDALDLSLANKGRTLPGTYHDYAIAAKLMKSCVSGYFLPYCFEEAADYLTAPFTGAPPAAQGNIDTVGDSHSGSVEDNYTLNWVNLPDSAAYDLELENTSSGGELRATLACDTGTAIATVALPAIVRTGETTVLDGFDPSSCSGRPFAAITNQSQTAADPETDVTRSYTVTTTAAAAENPPTVPPQPTEEPPDNSLFTVQGTGATTGGTSGANSTADVANPVIGSVRLSSRRFRAARAGPAIRSSPLGTRVRYRLNEGATVTVRYERRLEGRRVGGRCRAVTRRNRARSKCFRWTSVRGIARHRGNAGSNSFRLTGRIRGRALRLGAYRLRLSARDGSGNASRVRRSASFRIVRR